MEVGFADETGEIEWSAEVIDDEAVDENAVNGDGRLEAVRPSGLKGTHVEGDVVRTEVGEALGTDLGGVGGGQEGQG